MAEQAVDPADVPGEVASLQQGQLKGRQKLLRDGSGLASNGPPVLARGYVLGMAFEGHGHRTRFDDSKNTPSEFRGTGSRGTGSRNRFRGTGFEEQVRMHRSSMGEFSRMERECLDTLMSSSSTISDTAFSMTASCEWFVPATPASESSLRRLLCLPSDMAYEVHGRNARLENKWLQKYIDVMRAQPFFSD